MSKKYFPYFNYKLFEKWLQLIADVQAEVPLVSYVKVSFETFEVLEKLVIKQWFLQKKTMSEKADILYITNLF